MRLDQKEKTALQHALEKIDAEVYLFGSRVDDTKRGGDIDLLVLTDTNTTNKLRLSQEIVRKFFLLCEQKLDVTVLDKYKMTQEENAFFNSIKKIQIK